MLQIEHLLQRRPAQLAGGQRQRVAMGRALARDPQLFLFDEPLSNLDAKLRVEMRAEIKRLHQLSGITSVYVTHDQIEAMTLGSRIAVMKDGVLQQIGTSDDIYSRPANTYVASFIGSPTMTFIKGQVQSAGSSGCFVFDAGSLDLACPALGTVTLGVHPEHLVIAADAPWRGQVALVEPTGADTYIVLKTAIGMVTARTAPHTTLAVGNSVGLLINGAQANWFDVQTGVRIT